MTSVAVTRKKVRTLSKAAEAIRSHLAQTGDSLSGVRDGDAYYWAFVRSGLPVAACYVRELKAAGFLRAFGGMVDLQGEAACYVLQTNQTGAPRLACQSGAKCIAECNAGLCLDCAPAAMLERIRAGREDVPSNWIGARP